MTSTRGSRERVASGPPRISRVGRRAASVVAAATLSVAVVACAPGSSPSASPPSTAVEASAIIATFDRGLGQLPENITAAPGGVAVTFARSGQIATITPGGEVRVVATFPSFTADGTRLGYRIMTGIISTADGFEVLVSTGSSETTGLWRSNEGGGMDLIAALPAAGLPNGLATDPATGIRYAADSTAGVVFRIDAAGSAEVWSDADALTPSGRLGANGIKVHADAVYVSNFDRGTIVRIGIRPDGSADAATIVADGLAGIDDFAFTAQGDDIVAALNDSDTVVLLSGETRRTLLSAADGLVGSTATLVLDGDVYATSGAFDSSDDPNLVRATLGDS